MEAKAAPGRDLDDNGNRLTAARADVVIVGARCAGAPLATWLARAGLDVVLVDRARFPSDTLSTHVFQGGAIASLRRLGVLDDVLATGAPPVCRGRFSLATGDDAVEAELPMPVPAPGLPALLCVRRVALDAILHRTAVEAGATVLERCSLDGLVSGSDGRITAARLRARDGREQTVRASLVIGADGRGSSVARHAGARRYAVLRTERFGYFGYYADVPREDQTVLDVARDDRLYGFGVPADDGLYLACAMPPAADHAAFRDDIEASWDREVARLPRIGGLVAQGRRVGRPRGLRPVDTYLREATGPGWALVGDAGHFKDPSPGQGIGDALRQAEALARVVTASMRDGDLDHRLAGWARWRDRDALPRHRWAHAFGASGPPPHLLVQAQRDLLTRPDAAERLWGPSLQRMTPREALGPGAVARAAARSVRGRRTTPAGALAELAALSRRGLAYRRAERRLEDAA